MVIKWLYFAPSTTVHVYTYASTADACVDVVSTKWTVAICIDIPKSSSMIGTAQVCRMGWVTIGEVVM